MIVPGLGLLGLGLGTPGRLGEVLTMVGGVVTMVGLVLLVQNATDPVRHLGLCLGPGVPGRCRDRPVAAGVMRGRGDLTASGAWLIAAGLVAFLGLAVVFEVVVGIGGHRNVAASRYVLAALLILAALVLLGRRLLPARRP